MCDPELHIYREEGKPVEKLLTPLVSYSWCLFGELEMFSSAARKIAKRQHLVLQLSLTMEAAY